MSKNPKLGQAQRGLIAAFLCLAFGIAIFSSQSSRSPPPYNQPANKTEHSSPPVAAEDPPKITDWLLVLFSALLFGSTVLLWRANNRSAKIQERALTDLERPYIFIWGMFSHNPKATFTSSSGVGVPVVIQDNAAFGYSVSNRGKLAAVVETVSIACGYENNGRCPPLVIIGDHEFVQMPILSPEKDIENITHNVAWRELDRTNPSPDFRDGLIFRVVIYYRGPFTKEHETSQCWQWRDRAGIQGWVEDPRYTYAK